MCHPTRLSQAYELYQYRAFLCGLITRVAVDWDAFSGKCFSVAGLVPPEKNTDLIKNGLFLLRRKNCSLFALVGLVFLFKHAGAFLKGLFLAPIATFLLFHCCASPHRGDSSVCLTSTVRKMGAAKGERSVGAENILVTR